MRKGGQNLMDMLVLASVMLFGLILIVPYLLVELYFRLESRRMQKERAKYERQEWERHLGRDRCTLLRPSRALTHTAQLLHPVGPAQAKAPEQLLRPTDPDRQQPILP